MTSLDTTPHGTTDSFDPPLPPPTPELRMAKPEHFQAAGPDDFTPISGYGLEVRTLGIAKLTGGAVGAKIFRARKTPAQPGEEISHTTPWHMHDWGFQMAYVIKGWAEYEFEGVGNLRFEEGMSIYQLPHNRHRELGASEDFEVIEVTWPAETTITALMYDNEKGEYAAVRYED
ncbi:cupin domain-containing protein [Rhodococcus baikonurensis]|uniref:cupin domain-containing protein n=1 Tax=Rhodococcus erythropolis group TaxID=2840174 RepID=UPI00117B918C|nr:cupin domain-containing protein [Rhodococcus erythropolis]PBI88073.1 hypothetical protein BKP42_61530 [Rhodococcus erythropolis]